MIFGNDEEFSAEIQELRDLPNQLEIKEMLKAIESTTFTKHEVHLMLFDPFKFTPKSDKPMANEVLRFIKDLRFIQQKYLWMAMRDQIYGTIEKFSTEPPMEQDEEEEEEKRQEEEEIVFEILGRIRINQPVDVYNKHVDYPMDLIERDMLYVACQLTNHEDEYGLDKIQNFALTIAKRYQARELSEHTALRAMTQLLQLMQCIPVHFHQKFIYHRNNEYFSALDFKDPDYNEFTRNYVLFTLKKKELCTEDYYFGKQELNMIVNQIEEFMRLHNNNIDQMAEALEADPTFDQIYAIMIKGHEVANNGNGMLGIPESVVSHDLTQGNIDNVHITPGDSPEMSAASAEILRFLDELDAKLDAQLGEVNHFENSRIANNAIVYQLHPTALRRKNFWQTRGTEMPRWFPGVYTVFPDSLLSLPMKSNVPTGDLLLHAWRTMAPPISV